MKLLKKIILSVAVFFLFATPARSKSEEKNIVTRVNAIRKALKPDDLNPKKTYETNAGQFHADWVNWGNWGNWANWNNWNNWSNWADWNKWGKWGNY